MLSFFNIVSETRLKFIHQTILRLDAKVEHCALLFLYRQCTTSCRHHKLVRFSNKSMLEICLFLLHFWQLEWNLKTCALSLAASQGKFPNYYVASLFLWFALNYGERLRSLKLLQIPPSKACFFFNRRHDTFLDLRIYPKIFTMNIS